MQDTDHAIRHPRNHQGGGPHVLERRGSARHDDQFGRGQNTVLGRSDPTFGHDSVPKVMLGVAPAQHNFLRCLARVRRRILDKIREGRR
jgi:hypothetical protein